jgi:hypothetical protein
MRLPLSVLGLSLVAATASASSITTFTDQAAFNSFIISTIATEDFDDGTLDTRVFADSDPSIALSGSVGGINNSLFQVTGSAGASPQSTTFNLASGISAISLDIRFFGSSEDVTVTLSNGATFDILGPANGFFGFAAGVEIDSFTISDDDDDTVIALGSITAAVAPIPVPASLPLLIGALGAVGYAARRKKG